MFKLWPNEQVVRGVRRMFPNGGEGMSAIDVGCGAGRHSKLMLDLGFQVKALDIDSSNIKDTLANTVGGYSDNLTCVSADFDKFEDDKKYDLVVAWDFLYAYNKSINVCQERLNKINNLLKPSGKIIFSMKTPDDIFCKTLEKDENGVINNPFYGSPGTIYFSREEIVNLMNASNFEIEYIERFSRNHTMKWKNINGNENWKKADLDIYEDWWAICATKK